MASGAVSGPAGAGVERLRETPEGILETFWERDVKEIDDFFFDGRWLHPFSSHPAIDAGNTSASGA